MKTLKRLQINSTSTAREINPFGKYKNDMDYYLYIDWEKEELSLKEYKIISIEHYEARASMPLLITEEEVPKVISSSDFPEYNIGTIHEFEVYEESKVCLIL